MKIGASGFLDPSGWLCRANTGNKLSFGGEGGSDGCRAGALTKRKRKTRVGSWVVGFLRKADPRRCGLAKEGKMSDMLAFGRQSVDFEVDGN